MKGISNTIGDNSERKGKKQVVEGHNKQEFVAISNSRTIPTIFKDVLEQTDAAGDASCPKYI